MKITVINATEKQGAVYALKESFLRPFAGKAEIKEWYLPKDMPNFCNGCETCVTESETKCHDARSFMPIWKSIEAADLVVFATPTYAGHVPAALKNLLDHFEWAWMTHRPRPAVFGKRALILATCGIAGKSAATDITDSLEGWGFADIRCFRAEFRDASSAKDTTDISANIESTLSALSAKYQRTDFSVPAKMPRRLKRRFNACRAARIKLIDAETARETLSADSRYWQESGWLDKSRPWKK